MKLSIFSFRKVHWNDGFYYFFYFLALVFFGRVSHYLYIIFSLPIFSICHYLSNLFGLFLVLKNLSAFYLKACSAVLFAKVSLISVFFSKIVFPSISNFGVLSHFFSF